jgi:hypothetical protein
VVLHLCNRPACVRPDHLRLDTQWANMQHAVETGRMPRGERQGRAILTEAQVLEIRRLHATGEFTQREMGERFGVTVQTISAIIRRTNWRYLP